MGKKKVAGGIVIGLILIAAVMVIVWYATSTEEIDYAAKCSNAGITITKAEYNQGSMFAKVDMKLKPGMTEKFDGIELTFTDSKENSLIEYVEGNILLLEEKIREIHGFDFTPSKVEASVYFSKKDGTKYFCTQKVSNSIGTKTCFGEGNICVQGIKGAVPDCSDAGLKYLGDTTMDLTCGSGKLCCKSA